jgi:putative hydrolase of the HAD superfamily
MPANGQDRLSKLNAVIFDYGEVLCLPPTVQDLEASAHILDIPLDSFRVLWSRHRDSYDRGDLTEEAYWRKLAEDAGMTVNDRQLAQLAKNDVVMWSRLNLKMLTWLEDLSAAGMKTAVLSNMHASMAHHARQNFPWLHRVNCATLSAEVRLIKPDPAIYKHCLRGLDVAPTQCLFIDDREVNLAAARAMGIHGIQFRSIGQLKSELQAAGFRTLPRELPEEAPKPT